MPQTKEQMQLFQNVMSIIQHVKLLDRPKILKEIEQLQLHFEDKTPLSVVIGRTTEDARGTHWKALREQVRYHIEENEDGVWYGNETFLTGISALAAFTGWDENKINYKLKASKTSPAGEFTITLRKDIQGNPTRQSYPYKITKVKDVHQ
jgi:hypothetical protein